jgi:hypothetical protein
MMTIKVQCGCGQRYAFDAEPVNGRMASAVACPVCGLDGTAAANAIIAGSMAAQPAVAPALAAPAAPAARLALRTAVATAPAAAAPPESAPPPMRAAAPAPAAAPRHTPRLPGQVDRGTAQSEARAKMLWGDSREDVVKYLMLQGFSVPEAQSLVQEMFLERAATIRKNGIRKIITGILMMCAPLIAIGVMFAMGFVSPQLLAIPIMIGVYGAYCVLKGIIMTVAPKSEPGEVG